MITSRDDFPILKKKVHGHPYLYFDAAATSLKPKSVIDTMLRFYSEEYATVHRAIYQMAGAATEQYQNVREKARSFLNAKSVNEIIFTRGTTDAINLVAASFGKGFIKSGDEVIISEMEHHSNIVPWQLLCQERGAHLKVIPMDERGELKLGAYEKLLTQRTKLVSIAHVANATGTQNPIEEIIRLAHQKGAKVFIDGAQSASHLPVDVVALDADFFAFSGHKAYGPTGIGVLYGKEELLNAMPPYQGGSDMVEKVSFDRSTFYPAPLKFEAGTPSIAEVIGLGAALDYIESIGRPKIAAYEKKLLEQATEQLLTVKGLRILGTAREKGPIITFVIPGIHPLDLGTLLDTRGIAIRTGHLCAQPTLQRFGVTSVARLSFAAYNTPEELTLFTAALKEAIALLT